MTTKARTLQEYSYGMSSSPPYKFIDQSFDEGNVIPFLGAGAPLYSRDPRATPWFREVDKKEVIEFLPTAGELASYLAKGASLPDGEHGELTRMAQYYKAVIGVDPLKKNLNKIFSHSQEPTPLHEYLATRPSPLLIVTTNYDDLVERAFEKSGQPCEVVAHVTESNKVRRWTVGSPNCTEEISDDLDIDLTKVSVVYKIHGAIDRRADKMGSYVITEDDYIEFLTRMTRRTVIPKIFAEPFQSRPFLFLGYGLYDWNLRVILNRIQDFRRRPKFKSWAIETLAKPVERKLWEERGVEVFDGLTLDKFLAELKKAGGA